MASKWVVVLDDVDGVIGPFDSEEEANTYIETFPCGDYAFAVRIVEPRPMPKKDLPGQALLFDNTDGA